MELSTLFVCFEEFSLLDISLPVSQPTQKLGRVQTHSLGTELAGVLSFPNWTSTFRASLPVCLFVLPEAGDNKSEGCFLHALFVNFWTHLASQDAGGNGPSVCSSKTASRILQGCKF